MSCSTCPLKLSSVLDRPRATRKVRRRKEDWMEATAATPGASTVASPTTSHVFTPPSPTVLVDNAPIYAESEGRASCAWRTTQIVDDYQQSHVNEQNLRLPETPPRVPSVSLPSFSLRNTLSKDSLASSTYSMQPTPSQKPSYRSTNSNDLVPLPNDLVFPMPQTPKRSRPTTLVKSSPRQSAPFIDVDNQYEFGETPQDFKVTIITRSAANRASQITVPPTPPPKGNKPEPFNLPRYSQDTQRATKEAEKGRIDSLKFTRTAALGSCSRLAGCRVVLLVILAFGLGFGTGCGFGSIFFADH